MEYLRKTVHSKLLEKLFDLPENLKNRQVEVIILPFDENKKKNKPQISLGGRLNQYANPSLIPLEESAWQKAVEKKYENS
jgi:hypothetical protein